ncbi:MAG TPA: universal stress protein [Pseudobdellovibrionaceae bacterium]|jgi:nucleotide-binding universal stress UspA family protein
MEKFVSAVWAVDPTDSNLRPGTEALTEIRHFLGGGFSRVHPVYIYSDETQVMQNSQIQSQVQEYLKPLHLGETGEIETIFTASSKRADWAKKILQIAHSQKAQLILLTSHGRSTLGSFVLGSFAHEILRKSDVPVLFISPSSIKTAKTEKVLFATDFSKESKAAFQDFLQLIKGKTSEVILFHSINLPILSMSVAQGGGLSMSLPDSYLQNQKEWADSEIHHWLEEVPKSDMKIQFHPLVEDSLTSPAAAIEKIAERENVGLIGLTSHAGPVTRLIFGSVTQDLLSSQKFNLWVCGPAQTTIR